METMAINMYWIQCIKRILYAIGIKIRPVEQFLKVLYICSLLAVEREYSTSIQQVSIYKQEGVSDTESVMHYVKIIFTICYLMFIKISFYFVSAM